jgi:alpha-glucosidase (family GH31 glycosyl hydrolase)
MPQPALPPTRIRHVPYGIEDPYTPQPWERNPRDPRDGDIVTVAAVSEPRGAVQAVTVEVACRDAKRFSVPAKLVPYDGDGDRWEAVLGGFPVGSVVTYSFEARSTNEEGVTNGPHTFETIGWHTLQSVTSWVASPTYTLLRFCDGDGTTSTVSIEVADSRVVRLRIWPLAPATIPGTTGTMPCSAREEAELLIVEGGDLRLDIGLADGSMTMESGDGADTALRLSSGGDPLLAWLGAPPDQPHAIRLRLSLADDEALYGTGERFDQLDRRGLCFDAHVYEQYKNQGSRTYLPVPLLVSSRGYAVSVEGTRPLQIDAGATRKGVLDITADVDRDGSDCLEILFFLAEAPLGALTAYLTHVGLPATPPDWAFGLWMSANDWNSQEKVLGAVERAEQEGIPGDVLVIEAWSDETTFYIWNGADYQPVPPDRRPRLSDFHFSPDGPWPDPKGMIDTLHGKGMRLLLWQIPLLKHLAEPHAQQARDIETVIQQGWCATNANGTPYRNPGWWFPDAMVPDLTNPVAVEWWLSRRRYLVEELGVDGFKTDGGEHLWGRDIRFADGRRGDEMINAFPVLYAAAYHRLLDECGRTDGITFSRAGYAGSQRYPAHWAGDENSTWEAFRHSITAGLSAGASGIPFWGWDIAGFSEEIPSGELYRRAWMMATFCPIMQYHSEYNAGRQPSRDRTPWNIAERTGDPHVLAVCRYYAAVRRRLRPYIVGEASHVAATGRPLMCALALAYPDDRRCRKYPYQYLFGRDLLIAPTTEPGLVRQPVYLPAGRWRDLWSEASWSGPQELIADVPPDRIPVFVRAGAAPPLHRLWE